MFSSLISVASYLGVSIHPSKDCLDGVIKRLFFLELREKRATMATTFSPDALSEEFSNGLPNLESQVSPSTHNTIGIYLLVVGTLGTIGNGLILAMFIRFKNLLTPTAVLLVNLAVADLGICVFGFPFSATSSFNHTWMFGPGGCQWYAFMGFLFGSAHIGTLCLLAIDRYIVTCRSNLRGKLTYRRYCQYSVIIWLYAGFWSLMPLFGWGRYGLEPSITTCTIDWRHNDVSYKSFMVSYFLLGYVIPLAVMAYCYGAAAKRIKNQKQPSIRSSSISDKWANDKNVTFMCLVVLIGFVFAWSPYAVLCMWTVVGDSSSVPSLLTLIPPLFAKASTVFNPIIYCITNGRLRAGMMSTLACCSEPPGEVFEMSAEEKLPATTSADQ